MRLHRFLLCLPLVLVACGDLTELEGVYTISSWTENAGACDAEGPSILESRSETALYIKIEQFISEKFVNVVLCADRAECEQMAGERDTINLGRWGFQDGDDASGWRNTWYTAFTNFDDDTQCDGSRREDALIADADGGIRIEVRASQTVVFPRPSGVGNCFDIEDAQARSLVGEPACAQLEVVRAALVSGLP